MDKNGVEDPRQKIVEFVDDLYNMINQNYFFYDKIEKKEFL